MTQADVSALLAASRQGDAAAQHRLVEIVHGELSSIAAFLIRREYRPITLATGDLVNEAIFRLMQSPDAPASDRAHFLAIAARVMRQVLIDAARRRGADKRQRFDVTLSDEKAGAVSDAHFAFQALETALLRLQVIDPERAEIVIMRYYGGMSTEEIADALGVSESTVKRSWRTTRAWLKEAIENDPNGQ